MTKAAQSAPETPPGDWLGPSIEGRARGSSRGLALGCSDNRGGVLFGDAPRGHPGERARRSAEKTESTTS